MNVAFTSDSPEHESRYHLVNTQHIVTADVVPVRSQEKDGRPGFYVVVKFVEGADKVRKYWFQSIGTADAALRKLTI